MIKRFSELLALSIAALLTASVLLLAKPAAAARSLVGTWEGTFTANDVRCSMQSIYQSDKTYSELLHCGTLMTHQSGTYVVHGDLLVRSVEDWDPKQQWVVGACVGCGYWETLAKPPGGSYKITFSGANTLTLHDVNLGGAITMHRSSAG